MLTDCKLHTWKQTLLKFKMKYTSFHKKKINSATIEIWELIGNFTYQAIL